MLGLITTLLLGTAFANEPETVLIRDFMHLDLFCRYSGYGQALAWQQPLPWVDRVICIDEDGVREVTQTHNGNAGTMLKIQDTASSDGFVWLARTDPGNVSFTAALTIGCPGAIKPLAIIPTKIKPDTVSVTILDGLTVCSEGNDLTLYNPDHELMERWTSITLAQ